MTKDALASLLIVPGQIAEDPDLDNDEAVFISINSGVVFPFSNCFAHDLQT
jgi:hypothetical protein